ncbi:helix-turn-helix domain-containing protein [Spongiimicrobium sp. 3-5]|uniref:helix-turn-helix domain-containing protein n=1 Tax=Spongiimicrobium sp. 3-5 TaxID=3332596 RepID=UPI0039804038
MDLIFAIGAFQAIFMVLLVITKKNRSRADIPLIVYLSITAIQFGFYVYFNNYTTTSNFLAIWATGLHLLYGPLMHFYIIELIIKKSKKIIWFAKHLVIFFIWGFVYNLPNFFDLNFDMYVQNGFLRLSGTSPLFISLFSYSAILSGGGYSIWNLVILHKYRKGLKINYSSIDQVNLNWVSNWAYLFLFSFLVIFAVSLMPVSQYFVKISIAVSVTTVITYIGFSGYKQTNIFFDGIGSKLNESRNSGTGEPNSLSEKIRYSKSGPSNKNSSELIDMLENTMNVKKPYLNEDLSLYDLAEEIGVSRQILSQLINDNYKKTFYEFINDYRVKEAQRIIETDISNHLKIAAIGFDAGFRSRSTFYKFFKKNIGVTPVEYRKKNGASKE